MSISYGQKSKRILYYQQDMSHHTTARRHPDSISHRTLFVILVVVPILMAFTFSFLQAFAAGRSQVTNISFTAPLTTTFYNSCGDENVQVTGTFHVRLQQTTTPSERTHTVTQSNFSGVSGVGLTSGKTYQVPSVGNAIFNGDIDQVQVTSANHIFRLIGQGPENNLNVHGVLHMTWNANDELVVSFNTVETECR